jgi:hypothetical protein
MLLAVFGRGVGQGAAAPLKQRRLEIRCSIISDETPADVGIG